MSLLDIVHMNNRRLGNSLPSLRMNLPNLTKPKPLKKRQNSKKMSQEALTFIVSAFYAKVLVLLGVALPISDSIGIENNDNYSAFYVYLNVGSIMFLIYICVQNIKAKTFTSKSKKDEKSNEFNNRYQQNIRYNKYGSFYFRIGVTGFGIGTVIYSGLQFGQYFELSSENECNHMLKAIRPFTRILFVFMQMLFIFSYSNFVAVQKSKYIAKFGLMHMIATNLCEWLFVLIQETQKDIFHSAERRQMIAVRDNTNLSEADVEFLNSKSFIITKHFAEYQNNCLESRIMDSILQKSEPYLAPCANEYSLICAVILGIIWKNSCQDSETIETEMESPFDDFSYLKNGKIERHNKYSVDCAKAHKGLLSGIMVLALTLLSLIMYFELVSYKRYKDLAILQVTIWEAMMFATATLVGIMCILALRDLKFQTNVINMELEHFLLIFTQIGVFIYFLFQIIGTSLMGLNKGTKGGLIRIITPTTALIQSCCQTVLIFDAWRRQCITPSQIRKKPGRQLITFLLLTNISLWLVNRIKNNRAFSHPNQMDFYGVLAWNIITHVTMPLVVSYRFQATVCFYEIWKKVYKSHI